MGSQRLLATLLMALAGLVCPGAAGPLSARTGVGDTMGAALIGVALVLTLLVGILLGPPAFRDGPPHPGRMLCLLAVSVCLGLLTLAALRL